MDLTIDDDIQLRTRSGELLTINIPDLTCNFYVVVESGRVLVDRLWIGGRPFPQRGGEVDPFEDALALRIKTAIATDWADVMRRKWADEANEHLPSRRIQPFTGA